MIKKLFLALILVPTVALAGFTASMDARASRARIAIKPLFDEKLHDYPSARFKDVKAGITKTRVDVVFCGQVNAKNRLGGYAGWKQFSASSRDGGEPTLYISNGDDPRAEPFNFENSMATMPCDNEDINWDTEGDWSDGFKYQ